ncbi:MAG TPA: nitrite/sulfite reductase [Pseudobacteroides sp.]|uniref:nitrite/sulfite reductase n=1 Tax=Pseudobacteroides sp. TaxID=1968840 RepID=UPI002F92127B
MQYKDEFERRSEEEYIKDQGLVIDYDEIARRSKISKEESLISKWYGVYQSRQTGDFMARVVIPGGMLTSSQARKVAEAAQKYAKGLISITTRQALQLHTLKLPDLPKLMRDIKNNGLSTFHGCGDVVRTIPACPLAETCKYKRFNILPHAIETMKYLTSFRDLDNLPRKLKITFSGCSASCGQPYMNCIGIIAITRQNKNKAENGFKVVIGGGMGWKPFVAQNLFGFVPEGQIKEVCRAIALLYRDYGDRYNRSTSRLKFVVDRYGMDRCRQIVLQNFSNEGFDAKKILHEDVADFGVEIPPRPLVDEDIFTEPNDKTQVRIIIPKGEIEASNLNKIAELSEIYGNGKVYTDNRQNLSIHGIDNNKAPELRKIIHETGFQTTGFSTLKDIVSCVGTSYCPKAVTSTRSLYDLLIPIVSSKKYESITKKGIINITGCPNSCSPYRIADIGFRGMRIREESGSVEGYEVLVGGDQRDHGKELGEFKHSDCPDVLKNLLDDFLANLGSTETIKNYIDRKGIEYFKEIVYI